ncbi:Lrp/AsnC ligand binding domain-containing protein [Streptomyces sp. NPDC058770]|uniref:Lrp/AsnC ligand binding domain-containing protein n=1 Tax=Streptomyces sp. NPDC058770 TaxID=3346631 RepID=UPI0036D0451E
MLLVIEDPDSPLRSPFVRAVALIDASVRRLGNGPLGTQTPHLARYPTMTPASSTRLTRRRQASSTGKPSAGGLKVLIDVEICAQDRKSFEEFESTMAAFDEVIEFRRMYGRPDCFLRVAVADHAADEAFLTGKLSGLPGVPCLESHLDMKKIKADS